MEDLSQVGTLEEPKDLGVKPSDVVRRWILEIDLASKEEKNWRESVIKIYDRYRSEKQKKSSFNILWPITETMRPAIYNTMPKPDIRRRFRDEDKVGSYVSQVIERCASYSIDVYDFDELLKQSVMDVLLPGRAVSRVKYVPSFRELKANGSHDKQSDDPLDEDDESGVPDGQVEESPESETYEEIADERVICERVLWDDFRHGPGKTWEHVRWVAFMHRMTRDALKEKFGEIGDVVPLDAVSEDSIKEDNELANIFKTLCVWEVWDKDTAQVIFFAPSYKEGPLKTIADPLKLQDFFPCPRPFYAIEDSDSLIPATLWHKYQEQADELDRISLRINKLIDALRHRGVYNAVIKELATIQNVEDNTLLAADNVAALMESGGLEKHIWMMPIEQAANVVKVLYEQRDQCKQVIYELTGIADIMRGATDAKETMGAQKMKTQWGSQRLQRLQREMQRYVRDLIRLKCEVICNRFQPDTLKDQSGIRLLTNAEKAELQQQAQVFGQYQQHMQQMQQQQAAQAQQHPPMQPQQGQGMPHPMNGQPMPQQVRPMPAMPPQGMPR